MSGKISWRPPTSKKKRVDFNYCKVHDIDLEFCNYDFRISKRPGRVSATLWFIFLFLLIFNENHYISAKIPLYKVHVGIV